MNKEIVKHESMNPAKLLEIAINKDLDIEKLERLMIMQEKWDAQQAKKSFLKALSKFQELCPIIRKTKQGHNYKYAPLDKIIEQVKTPLRECGLSYRWEASDNNGETTVTCVISHVDGHCETNQMTAKPDTSGSKNAIQAIGSTRAYLHRYTFIGALGIGTADVDDDGGKGVSEKKKVESLSKKYQELDDELSKCTDLEQVKDIWNGHDEKEKKDKKILFLINKHKARIDPKSVKQQKISMP